MSIIDLHTHSTYSDGKDSPEEIIQKAKSGGVKFLSLTDHDTVGGLKRAKDSAVLNGIKFVNGLEISVLFFHKLYHEGQKSLELHMLGYNFDPENKELLNTLQENRNYRQWRAKEMVKKVNNILEKENQSIITEQEYEKMKNSIGGTIGRPHLAQILIDKKIVSSVYEAFQKYLNTCNVPKKELSFEKGSSLIKNAGGKVVLAHPFGDKEHSLLKVETNFPENDYPRMVREMKPFIDGIETFYWDYTSEQMELCQRIAERYDLIPTVGSDHHGGEKDRVGKIYSLQEISDFRKLFL